MATVVTRIPYGKTVTIYPPEASEKRTRMRSRIVCFQCGAVGHWRSECATWKTRMCVNWRQNKCALEASQCPFAHGAADLRGGACERAHADSSVFPPRMNIAKESSAPSP